MEEPREYEILHLIIEQRPKKIFELYAIANSEAGKFYVEMEITEDLFYNRNFTKVLFKEIDERYKDLLNDVKPTFTIWKGRKFAPQMEGNHIVKG